MLSHNTPQYRATTVLRDVIGQFIDELRQSTAALTHFTATAIACFDDTKTQWITLHDQCTCCHQLTTPPACFTGHRQDSRHCEVIEARYEGKSLGSVIVCCDSGQSPVLAALQQIVQTVVRRVELERENASLLVELAGSWESLEAVYELSSDMRILQDPADLLDRITAKAASIHAGLGAILWLETDGQLVPMATKNISPLNTRPLGEGLIARVLAERGPIILNSRIQIISVQQLEPELRQAVSLAIVPVATRQGLLGVLEVWQNQGEPEFDSRMLRLLEALALQAAMVIENDRLHRAALESERLRQEVQIGSDIQQILLLGQPPEDFPDLEVAALTIPSQRIDGDFYEFVKQHERCLDVIVGDVMGKGIPAALLGAATKSHFLRAIGRLASDSAPGKLAEPTAIVRAVAAAVTKQLIDLESFVTLCYARIDLDKYQLDLVDCGHTRTIHLNRDLGTCTFVRGNNLPLGVLEGETYTQVSLPLRPGDVLLFYSDGVTEARDPSGQAFGEESLAEMVRTNGHISPQQLIEVVRTAATTFSQPAAVADDLTCVAVKIGGAPEHPQMTHTELEIWSDLAELDRVRRFVYGLRLLVLDSSVSEERFSELALAVHEAVCNIIVHAYHRQPGQRLRLEADVCVQQVTVRIYDWGEAFDPSLIEPPSFDGSKESGFGVYIIAHSVDEVQHSRDVQGSNCIRLVKRLGRKGTRHAGHGRTCR
jgi:serine phosphatase RsbU (regulator of sigma subunit)/anti-sigma regulatory factor (Ser/Thr protein kinase)